MKRRTAGCVVLGVALRQLPSAAAHGADASVSVSSVWWLQTDPWSAALLLGTAWLYLRAGRKIDKQRPAPRRGHASVLFWSGLVTLAVALGPPLDPFGARLFSAHMLQHEILMLASAPLLIVSRPAGRLLRGMPAAARRLCLRGIRSLHRREVVRWSLTPAGAWSVHAVALWAWHLPWLFEAGLRSDAVHAAQHASFFLSALLFWHTLLRRDTAASGGAVLYLFSTALHTGVLGALLTLAPTSWYPAYRFSTRLFGLSALEDQQLGGLIMWVPAGLVFLAAALWLLARLLQARPSSLHWRYGGDGTDADS